jgi:hypothetical protein
MQRLGRLAIRLRFAQNVNVPNCTPVLEKVVKGHNMAREMFLQLPRQRRLPTRARTRNRDHDHMAVQLKKFLRTTIGPEGECETIFMLKCAIL